MLLLGYSVITILKILFATFNGILFSQSGLDKVFHYQGNLSYFQSHFKKSPLASAVGILLPVVTLLETAAGLTSLVAVVLFLINSDSGNGIGSLGMLLGGISLLCLFFGQRLAQDYAGAAVLVAYFLMTMAGLALYIF